MHDFLIEMPGKFNHNLLMPQLTSAVMLLWGVVNFFFALVVQGAEAIKEGITDCICLE